MKKITVSLFILVISLPISSFAATTSEIQSLRGLKKISVVIEQRDPDTKDASIELDRIRTITELKLRLAGIEVVEFAPEYLYLTAACARIEVGDKILGYAVHSSLDLVQRTPLLRDMGNIVFSRTWHTHKTNIIPGTHINTKYKSSLDGLVDKFINDYLSANPKIR